MGVVMDESQWLPKGTPIVSPHRQKMLGLHVEYDNEGLVKYAKTTTSKTILQWLYNEGLLDDKEYHDGRDYEMWRSMFNAFCGNQRMTANYGATVGINLDSNTGRESYYSKLIRLVPGKYIGFINAAVDNKADDTRLIRYYAETYQRAFNRLGAAMDTVRIEMQDYA